MTAKALVQPMVVQDASAAAPVAPLGVRIGRIVALDDNLAPLVDYPGNTQGPVAARLALGIREAGRLSEEWSTAEVLIAFADQDMRQPVITGVVSDTLPAACAPDLEPAHRLLLQAADEIVLQCGDARIVLRRDGKLFIAGQEIVSRALRTHRIRGGTVSIN